MAYTFSIPRNPQQAGFVAGQAAAERGDAASVEDLEDAASAAWRGWQGRWWASHQEVGAFDAWHLAFDAGVRSGQDRH